MEQLKNIFLNLEEAIINEIPEEDIIKISYEAMNFIENNRVSIEEEINTLVEVGANHPMSMLYDWYEDAQYRLNYEFRNEVI